MLVAVVLAGGAARRMGGGDKPLLPVGGRTMLQSVIEALGVPETAISANGDPSRFAAFGLPVLPDGPFAGCGPLAGVLAGLRWAERHGATVLITAPGDMPFLPRSLPQALLPAPTAVIAGSQPHHLVATWPVACADALEWFLRNGATRRVQDFAELIGMRYKHFPAAVGTDFVNINTKQELVDARRQQPEVERADDS
jgi:molybdenum cofactor guanylyltransferase